MEEKSTSNRTLERTAAILDSIANGPKLASQIARETGLSLSTTHRLALAMVETGFLERFEDATFGPGSRIITGVREEFSYAPLWELSTEVNETVQLWVRSGDHRVCLMSVEAPHELRITLPVGARLPLPAGSSGAILAETAEAAASLAKFGWVESEGKRVPGVGSVSAPIIVNGRILGAVCIAMPLNRVIRSVGQDFGDATRHAAEKMAAQLA
ncbi:IclR family transcriptional regulator [Corynebacterium glutamicum]|uniref:IclR family transcriptional regulator n=1 Tax=Corynebacterium glutamicum TaxID=1718 RepID=UPI0009426A7B|nr:helix-turn-helix domain-containing protein [Corynebacterium glutamicum]OKX87058.1 ArsR family transcriptional regulator [Corynebacterium glutamicum]QDX74377.1 ArsR family transcriptional regulator [Corynebacterium glutamicum]QDX77135.1 ArsR family transcriptional regulator [Corynebacterium glutamicum]TWS34727.1 ArsR family transcriptional regulator [Corynebacterium glutamicum]TWS37741.1 ArsR family transcriptional regulator [Corynebacterium glutamicum]